MENAVGIEVGRVQNPAARVEILPVGDRREVATEKRTRRATPGKIRAEHRIPSRGESMMPVELKVKTLPSEILLEPRTRPAHSTAVRRRQMVVNQRDSFWKCTARKLRFALLEDRDNEEFRTRRE